MNAAPPSPYFCCRVCQSREYERVVVKRPDGKPYNTAFYACMGCTVMFGDPERYTSPPPQPKVTRVDAPISFRRSREVGRFVPAKKDSPPGVRAADRESAS